MLSRTETGEEEGLVEHHADVGPEAGQGQVAHVVPVDPDRPGFTS